MYIIVSCQLCTVLHCTAIVKQKTTSPALWIELVIYFKSAACILCCLLLLLLLLSSGLLQVDAFFTNQLRVTPLMINLPSDLRQQHINTTVRLQWQGLPVNTSRQVVMYDISHVPAAAMTLSNGWYGTDKSIEYLYEAAEVNFEQQVVAINTSSSKTRKLQVRSKLNQ